MQKAKVTEEAHFHPAAQAVECSAVLWTERLSRPMSRLEYARYRMARPHFVPNHIRRRRAAIAFLLCLLVVCLFWFSAVTFGSWFFLRIFEEAR